MVAKVKGVRRLVDRGQYLDSVIKRHSKELERIKNKLRQHAEASDRQLIVGTTAKVMVNDWSQSNVDPNSAYRAVGGQITDFLEIIKVNITDLKRKIGPSNAEQIIQRIRKPYHSVSFYALNEPIQNGNNRPTRMLDRAL